MPKAYPAPTWVRDANAAAIVASIKATAAAIFNNKKLEETMGNLASRWLDEREYENIADYANVLKPIVEKLGAVFVEATKRPFGFICHIKGIHYRFTIKSNGNYEYTRLAIK